MQIPTEFRTGLRLLIMALVFLAMSCEADGDDDGCLGNTDAMIVGCGDGCGTGCSMVGKGCLGECLMGSNEGCGAGEGCIGDCGDCGDCDTCGDCGDPAPYKYDGDVVEGAIQVHVTDSLFRFVEGQILDIIEAAAGDMLLSDDYCRRCTAGTETWDCGNCADWRTYCLAPMNADPVKLCVGNNKLGPNCNVEGSVGGPNNGCAVHFKLGQMSVATTTAGGASRVNVHIPIDDLYAHIPVSILGKCTIKLGKKKNSTMSATIGVSLRVNQVDGNTELYVGDETISFNTSGLQDTTDCFVTGIAGGIPGLLNTAINSIGAVTCRGCQTNADCGGGSTCGAGKVCTRPNGTSQQCAGLQLGADVKLNAAPLLESIDPSVEGLLGVRAFLGSYVQTNDNGLQLGARLGGKADRSLCVPLRDSPITAGLADCRTGDTCQPLAQLNTAGRIKNPATGTMDPFHIGVGVAMGGLNQVLFSAYESGVLCLSLGGESPGLEMLSTGLFSTFIGSLGSLTYNTDQPLMVQLRPQQAPKVDFVKSVTQGAELIVKIPELEIDFYTIVDHRYARIFTLGADIELPLGLKGETNMLEIAIGDLANVIDPASVTVSNVEMVSLSQVQSLVNNLPSLIGALTGVLGDELIPPIEIPEFSGIKVQFVGPGLTIIEENNKPAALGLFLNMDISPEDIGGVLTAMEPVITNLDIDIRDPNELRADIAARNRADQSFSYHDLMPKIVAHMDVTGIDLDASALEYAYSINGGPWSFWTRGPVLTIDNPILAAEAKYDVRITARVAGDATTGSANHAKFSFVNDYSAPKIALEADGSVVRVIANDSVYNREELTMQYRFAGGAWSQRTPLQDLDILPQLLNGPVALDVMVSDPSGNARSVRRSFGATDKISALGANENGLTKEDGCSTSQGKGGIAAVLALLALVFFRRRENGAGEGSMTAASPVYIGLAILTVLFLGLGSTGCKSEDRGAGDCVPACDSASMCIGGECIPISCEDDKDCAGNDKCIDGVCVAEKTCEYADDCDYGQICKDGLCTPSECSSSEDCGSLKCTAPELPYCEYDDYASVEAGECICSAGVELGRHGGWLNVLALDGGETTVALALSEQYGDLIFGTLQDDGVFEWEFIDGVPEGPVDRPPTGLRSGISAPGDEAGRYVSVVAEETDGEPVLHMAYQYRERNSSVATLRYARAARTGDNWAWSFVDVDTRDFNGMFPSVFLNQSEAVLDGDGEVVTAGDGGVGIFFMMRDIAVENEGAPLQYFSSINVAYASTLTPESAGDFEIREIDQAENPIPCGGTCPSNSLCASSSNLCVSTGTGCGECAEGEACVKAGSGSQCEAATAATAGGFSATPRGTGLFTSSLVAQDGSIHAAYYDQVHGNLMYARAALADGVVGVQNVMIVDGESAGKSTGDVGRWTRIQELPSGGVVIFYEDAGRAELRAAVVTGTTVKITVLDSGNYADAARSAVQSNRVGSSIYTRALEAGGYEVFYQDTTNGVARRVMWPNVAAAPSGHPHAVFGAPAGLERELTSSGTPLDPSEIAVAIEDGAVGFFVNVVEGVDRTIFASKQINQPRGSSNSVPMRVTTGTIDHAPEANDDQTP